MNTTDQIHEEIVFHERTLAAIRAKMVAAHNLREFQNERAVKDPMALRVVNFLTATMAVDEAVIKMGEGRLAVLRGNIVPFPEESIARGSVHETVKVHGPDELRVYDRLNRIVVVKMPAIPSTDGTWTLRKGENEAEFTYFAVRDMLEVIDGNIQRPWPTARERLEWALADEAKSPTILAEEIERFGSPDAIIREAAQKMLGLMTSHPELHT